jgi:hypothetical protein
MRPWIAIALLFLASEVVHAQSGQRPANPGDVFEISVEAHSSSRTEPGGSGQTHSSFGLVERVIGARDGGVEVEFDLPEDTSAEDRSREWEYPARVLRTDQGSLQLLNGPEMEERIARWLEAAQLPRSACGSWYFTWTAFQIECDPQSVIPEIEAFDLGAVELRDEGPYRKVGTLGSTILRRTGSSAAGATFVATLQIDPGAVRRQRAEIDRVLAEVSRAQVPTMEAALAAHSSDRISGTVTITFEAAADGRSIRRTTVTEMEIAERDGRVETSTSTEIVTRRRVTPRTR